MRLPSLGVVIVTFNSADVIIDCIESLLGGTGVQLTVVIVDNGSTDDTLPVLRSWATGLAPALISRDIPFEVTPAPKPLTLWHPDAPLPAGRSGHHIVLVEAGENRGFAAGVNRGLAYLATLPDLDRFWVLNPDSVVPPDTPKAFATAPAAQAGFSLMGGRVLYLQTPDVIQIDGGTINWLTGVTSNIHLGASHAATPAAEARQFDFITGASVIASRRFYEKSGPLSEDYFLYYEEVDWAMRRGDLPLAYCPGGIVYHRAGSSIGSATLNRSASAFSTYFKHRSRLKFIRKFSPSSLPVAFGWSLLKAAQLRVQGHSAAAAALFRAALHLPPPSSVRLDILRNGAVYSNAAATAPQKDAASAGRPQA